MEKSSAPLALNAAAWFFVGQSEDAATMRDVPIETPFRIGRNDDVDLSLPSRSVSGTHAKILEEDGAMWIYDLGSTNGTFVNGKRVKKRARLSEGDTVQFAATVFQVTRAKTESKSSDIVDPSKSEKPHDEEMARIQFDRLFTGGVVPFYQPIIAITDPNKPITGYEVLGRSRLFGLHTPAEMFAAASQLEMEAELSRVLRKQGIEVASNSFGDEIALYVNTHPAELQCDGLVESLAEIREEFPNRPITLEVHESVLDNPICMVTLRSALDNSGIKLAFDDFGAGPSRLVELSEVGPDVLKFNVKLIQGIDTAAKKRQNFVATLVKMVTDLGITPLAECVETSGEHETLCQLGFRLGQGFLYGKPSAISDDSDAASDDVPPTRPKTSSRPESVPLVRAFLDDNKDRRSCEQKRPAEDPKKHKNAHWILAQPSDQYTIQVLSAISRERAEQYIETQDSPEKFAIFRKQGKTRILYIVVYGVFEDRAAAKAATSQLASSTVSPWIRRIAGVHAEIETTDQRDS